MPLVTPPIHQLPPTWTITPTTTTTRRAINHFIGERWPSVDVVEFLGVDRDEQDDDTEENGEPEVGGVHAVERDTLVVMPEHCRVCHQRHHEVHHNRAPDEQVVDARPEIRLQATLHHRTP